MRWTLPLPPSADPIEVPLNGVIIVDKPGAMTSHDVVDRVRRRLNLDRVGHLGTLDPAATGVLPLALGKATRLARFVRSSPKEYTGAVRLGWATTTCDLDGDPLGEARPADVSVEAVLEAMAGLTGRIQQVPPAYSAKKISGKRAYRLARQGKAPVLEPVPVEVLEFELESLEPPFVRFRAVCSAGTYVRSLARDLGQALETGGHLFSLRRTRAGDFGIERAVSLEDVSLRTLIPLADLVGHLPRIEIGPELEEGLAHGRGVPSEATDSPVCIFNKKGELMAVASVERGWAQPRVVLL